MLAPLTMQLGEQLLVILALERGQETIFAGQCHLEGCLLPRQSIYFMNGMVFHSKEGLGITFHGLKFKQSKSSSTGLKKRNKFCFA